jgi:WD40 repeat protein
MRFSRYLRLLVCLSALAAGPEDDAAIQRLVRQLGSDSFAQREAAAKRLAELGEAAEPHLRRALTSGDAEVARRARVLLEALHGPRSWRHNQPLQAVAFAPDGQTLLAGDSAGGVQVLSARGALRRSLRGHTDSVVAVAFAPDGRRALSASHDGTVRLWDLRGGKEVLRFEGHAGAVKAAAFTPDGRQVLSLDDQVVLLWDAATGKEIRRLRSRSARPALDLAIHPEGKLAATGHYDYGVRLWDLDTGQQIDLLTGHTNAVAGVRFAPDGKRLASWACSDPDLLIWDVGARKVMRRFRGADPKFPLSAAAFHPDGRRLIFGCEDGSLYVCDTRTGQERDRLKGHTEAIRAVAVSPDGRWLASVSNDQTLRLWPMAE